ncbi:hypothetical protein TSOC_005321 [Tetrabaena socialis]|uniref:2,3-bisphosphoglycerate-dependent phosphoglycerate mutase n=1 Tax=Tetrabaena socialis TaxID=47790 RepID=A0A2J8A6L0_9CHLO|nr:hypothetical protein TSOC_005321 [Tetrabaena socialis]|eukprot:PNH08166.1 hypothetical protein TSOC_005321 [Tetrabaena socialis]
MAATLIVVLRHGKREDSANPGWLQTARYPWDTPLVAGDRDAYISEAATQLQKHGVAGFDAVYVSPFLRTAERLLLALGQRDVPVLVHKALSEVHDPGLLFRARAPSLAQRARLWLWRSTYNRHSRPQRQCFARKARVLPGSWPTVPESEREAGKRYRAVIMQLAALHPGQQVLFVSHGNSVQVAHEALRCPGRVQQVAFCGYVAGRSQAPPPEGGPAAGWAAFEGLCRHGVDTLQSEPGEGYG